MQKYQLEKSIHIDLFSDCNQKVYKFIPRQWLKLKQNCYKHECLKSFFSAGPLGMYVLMQIGRHYRIDAIMTSHLRQGYSDVWWAMLKFNHKLYMNACNTLTLAHSSTRLEFWDGCELKVASAAVSYIKLNTMQLALDAVPTVPF